MEWRRIRYFYQVVMDGSISLAANHLNISQPSLSVQIRELENDLGIDLFYRAKNRLHLTEAGRFLAQRAHQLLDMDEKILIELQEYKSGISNDIWIGGIDSGVMSYVVEEVAEYAKKHNSVLFHIRSSSEEMQHEMLTQDRIDIGIVAVKEQDEDDFEYLQFPCNEEWGLVVLRNNEEVDEVIQPKGLTRLKIICNNLVLTTLVKPWMKEYVDELAMIASSNLLNINVELVRKGLGVLVTTKGTVECDDRSEFKFVPFSPALETTLYLKWKKGHERTKVVYEFIEQLKTSWRRE